ncbi:OmpA family protein [Litorimonas taeanensis]|uniref:OmpA family protein n=1 Tax=Litorimonas taeanensis TaxID=568099 RepID=A0A420WIV3_9PROT|nr:OmpA family protein [Litorimonas taeanensis]RKQ70862.1 OmpA family protein [Litorimonas taeanensis]
MRNILVTTIASTAIVGLAACSSMYNESDNKNVMNEACEARTMAVFFDNDSADFDQAAQTELNAVASAYDGCEIYRIEVAGYADSIGDSDYNLELSDKRAENTVSALMQRGVTANRISIVPMGDRTAMNTDTSDAWERRVVITLTPYAG